MFSKTRLMVMLASAAVLGCNLNSTRKDSCNTQSDCLEGLSCVNQVCSDTPVAEPGAGKQFTDTDTCEPAGPVQIGSSVYYNYIANGEPSSTACWNPANMTFVTDQTSCGSSSPTHNAFQFNYGSSVSQQFTILPNFGSSNFILSFFVDFIDPHHDAQNLFLAEVLDGNMQLAQYDHDGSQGSLPPCSRIDLPINQNLDGRAITVHFTARSGYPDTVIRVWGISFFQGPGRPQRGDFNIDWHADLLWRNPLTGNNSVWYLNGTEHVGGGALRDAAPRWTLGGIGDFDGNGFDDLVWRDDATGETVLWFMQRSDYQDAIALPQVPSPSKIAGVGDVDGDGHPDVIYWNPTTGVLTVRFMTGTQETGTSWSFNVGGTWQPQGSGDFDKDGHADLLWRNADGAVAMWTSITAAQIQAKLLPAQPDANWRIGAIADLDGDGRADLVWRNGMTGANEVWYLHDAGTSISPLPSYAGLDWQIVGPR